MTMIRTVPSGGGAQGQGRRARGSGPVAAQSRGREVFPRTRMSLSHANSVPCLPL